MNRVGTVPPRPAVRPGRRRSSAWNRTQALTWGDVLVSGQIAPSAGFEPAHAAPERAQLMLRLTCSWMVARLSLGRHPASFSRRVLLSPALRGQAQLFEHQCANRQGVGGDRTWATVLRQAPERSIAGPEAKLRQRADAARGVAMPAAAMATPTAATAMMPPIDSARSVPSNGSVWRRW